MVSLLSVQQSAIDQLLSLLEQRKKASQLRFGSPLSDLDLSPSENKEIQSECESLEAINPTLFPLLYKPYLLDGVWELLYSTAREIRALSGLKWGLQVGKVYQVIDLASQSFFNLALVKHQLELVSGYVLVTATFTPKKEDSLPNRRLEIQFDQRYLAISNLAGFNTPKLSPFKVVAARNPVGRVPVFDITYLDEGFRIGRGGDGSLYVLRKSQDVLDSYPLQKS